MRYFDFAATTPAAPEVAEAMRPWFTESFHNASSLYSGGRAAAGAVRRAREAVMSAMGASDGTLIFTSGGTESDNTALIGAALKSGRKAVAVSAIEHHAVLESAEFLGRLGREVRIIPVDRRGRIDMDAYRELVDEDVAVVSVMWANNEIGTLQDIGALSEYAHERGAVFHTDAVQALPSQRLDVSECGADMVSVSAHKIYGPKGCGALWLRSPELIEPYMHGGQQESHLRGGTENVPAIVGFGRAAQMLEQRRDGDAAHAAALREIVMTRLAAEGALINTDPALSVPGILNAAFSGVEAEGVIFILNMEGYCISMGSACNSESVEPSHVIRAIGVPEEYARGCLRISFGRGQTEADALELAEAVIRVCRQQMSD